MVNAIGFDLVLETDPKPDEIHLLEERLYQINVQTTGIDDAKLLAWFLRDDNEAVIGGTFGWTWGAACYIRYLYIPENLRRQGLGSALMRLVEGEAKARGCGQIVLETHDFQAPEFYQKLGFGVIGCVENYPLGRQYLTMVKRLVP